MNKYRIMLAGSPAFIEVEAPDSHTACVMALAKHISGGCAVFDLAELAAHYFKFPRSCTVQKIQILQSDPYWVDLEI